MTDVFFGIQVAVQSPPGDPWRAQLAQFVRQHQQHLRVVDKRGMFAGVTNLLLQAADRFTLGFWDYVDDGEAEYADWTGGLEDDASTTWVPDAGAVNDHALVSLVFLLPGRGDAASVASERCDLPESAWRTRDTFRHLLSTVAMLPFGSVAADAIYLSPGGLELAFSLRELQTEDYGHLLPVE